ncbi:acyl-CoA dehydrogenase [Microbacterium elymi]|uniref:Acyl-CoA dehydrogenase n=1 Tax=Microbacterium elymi TaxID=2909587 RepID=A0ABY5NM98_9MICO|nr:acyl-CoA dehydrogenase [Microbacterium elymi]UUT36272.1 acyl-CoA dehydrogenase [Microbacterium elymi]
MSPAAGHGGTALTLADTPSAAARDVERAAADVGELGTQVEATIEWAVRLSSRIPLPGQGRTADRWSALATAGALDVGAARILEPHLDALAILDEARTAGALASDDEHDLDTDGRSSWGVFAAEGAARVDAHQDAAGHWRLRGTKPWCSLAAQLSHALITAWVGPQARRLFAVSLRDPSVRPHSGPWVARGLRAIVSAAVDFDGTPAIPVGETDWYLNRPGFRWGGMGVAAVWWGGTSPIVDALTEAAERPDADQIAQLLCGEADAEQWAAKVVLADAARRVDAPPTSDARALAERVRAVAARAAERVLTLADHGLGPGPLTTNEDHARRVADLRIYLRQHHAERDLARLGRSGVT